MELIALSIALLALVLVLARGKVASSSDLEELRTDARRRIENLANEIQEENGKLRQLLARVAAGESVDAEQIEEGRLWRDVTPEEGKQLVEKGGLHLLDVRTPQETAAGIVPGALQIPIDQLEGRLDELPTDGKPMLIYCAVGGRSSAACEFLSTQGFSSLMNLDGGMSAWSGPTQKP